MHYQVLRNAYNRKIKDIELNLMNSGRKERIFLMNTLDGLKPSNVSGLRDET